jgi:hypothetical protein
MTLRANHKLADEAMICRPVIGRLDGRELVANPASCSVETRFGATNRESTWDFAKVPTGSGRVRSAEAKG